jgi:hypothetical protein
MARNFAHFAASVKLDLLTGSIFNPNNEES